MTLVFDNPVGGAGLTGPQAPKRSPMARVLAAGGAAVAVGGTVVLIALAGHHVQPCCISTVPSATLVWDVNNQTAEASEQITMQMQAPVTTLAQNGTGQLVVLRGAGSGMAVVAQKPLRFERNGGLEQDPGLLAGDVKAVLDASIAGNVGVPVQGTGASLVADLHAAAVNRPSGGVSDDIFIATFALEDDTDPDRASELMQSTPQDAVDALPAYAFNGLAGTTITWLLLPPARGASQPILSPITDQWRLDYIRDVTARAGAKFGGVRELTGGAPAERGAPAAAPVRNLEDVRVHAPKVTGTTTVTGSTEVTNTAVATRTVDTTRTSTETSVATEIKTTTQTSTVRVTPTTFPPLDGQEFFLPNRSNLMISRTAAEQELAPIVAAWQTGKYSAVVCVGRVRDDGDNNPDFAYTLSTKRASVLVNMLKAHGVTAIGYGVGLSDPLPPSPTSVVNRSVLCTATPKN